MRKLLTVALLSVFAVVALMFSAVLLGLLLVLATVGGAYLWWRTRKLRRQFRAMQDGLRQMQEYSAQREVAREEPASGRIIEGEAVYVPEPVGEMARRRG